jgi:hypothetical protein
MLLFRRVRVPRASIQLCDARDFVSSTSGVSLVSTRCVFARLTRSWAHFSISHEKETEGKAPIEDQDDTSGVVDQDGGDLFGDLAAETTKITKAAPPFLPTNKEAENTKIQPSSAAYSPEKKVQFEDLLSRLESRAGKSLQCTTTSQTNNLLALIPR